MDNQLSHETNQPCALLVFKSRLPRKNKFLNFPLLIMKVYFGSDHHGGDLRPKLMFYVNELGHESEDLGMSNDFPIMAQKLVKNVLEHDGSMGILICETGQGMAITANRYPGIRAAVCSTATDAKQAREHLNANILTLGADHVKYPLAKEIVETFLATKFIEEERYNRRIKQTDDGGKFLRHCEELEKKLENTFK